MLVHDILALILCANLALTSSVSKTATDVSFKDTREVVYSANNSRDDAVVSSTPIPSSTTDNILRNKTHIIMAEGGPIYQSQSVETSSSNLPAVIANETSKFPDKIVDATLTTKDSAKMAKTRNASIVPRKGVIASSKITPRKGVGPESSSMMETSTERTIDVSTHTSSTEKIEKVESKNTKIINDTRQTTVEKVTALKIPKIDVSSNITIHNTTRMDVEKISTISPITNDNVSTIATKILDSSSTTTSTTSTTMSSSTTRRFKPKPTVTIGEMDVDKPIPASPTKTPPLGMPRKIDYIVPVIITIMALPLLGGMAFFMYRRGRDCWDKRHYRRMDFLIDGMYNDYSWK